MSEQQKLFPEIEIDSFIPEIFEGMAHGQECNLSGKFLETTIENDFHSRGVISRQYSKVRETPDLFLKHMLLKNVPYVSLFQDRAVKMGIKNAARHKCRSEFLYLRPPLRVRIECKVQLTAGSVDEKFHYFMDNAKNHMPEMFVWLVVHGDGLRPEAWAYLKYEAEHFTKKVIRVYTLAEAQRAIKPLVERGVG